MKATEFEFKYRALLIGLIFWAGYAAYAVDHASVIEVIARWASRSDFAGFFLTAQLLVGLATLLIGFGAAVRTWGAAYLQSSVVHDAKLHSDALVADGPYRHVRHPLYFASIVASFGFALLASRAGFLIIIVPMTLLYVRLVGREEAELDREQGERHREYARRVPRLWPSIAARLPATGARPQWGQAFRGEAFMWAFTAAFALFAVTLNEMLLWWTIALALLFLIGQTVVHNRRKKKGPAAT